MAEENGLLRQQREQVMMNLAEQDAKLTTTLTKRNPSLSEQRVLKMSGEAAVQEGSGGRRGQIMQQASAGQLVPEQGYPTRPARCTVCCCRKIACGCPI